MAESEARLEQRGQMRCGGERASLRLVRLAPEQAKETAAREAGAGQERAQLGIVVNYSAEGLAVQAFEALPEAVGFQVALATERGGWGEATGRARAVWAGEGGRVGLRLTETTEAARECLRRWLEEDSRAAAWGWKEEEVLRRGWAQRPAGSGFDSSLRLIARHAMAQLRASGAAIALGDAERMSCRASVGDAPSVGVRVRAGEGLAGRCVRTASAVESRDARQDERVDPRVASELEARSMVMIPVMRAGAVAGVVAAFWRTAYGFGEAEVEGLRGVAEVIAQALEERPERGGEAESQGKIATGMETLAGGAGEALTEAATARPSALPPRVAPLRRGGEAEASRHRLWVIAALLLLLLVMALWMAVLRPAAFPRGATGSLAPLPVAPAARLAETMLRMEPAERTPVVGSTFAVRVMLQGAREIAYVPLEVSYDAERLEVAGVFGGGLLERDGQSVALVHRETPELGRIRLAASRPPGAGGISGDGAVFNLLFTAKAPGTAHLRSEATMVRDAGSRSTAIAAAETVVRNSAREPRGHSTEKSGAAAR